MGAVCYGGLLCNHTWNQPVATRMPSHGTLHLSDDHNFLFLFFTNIQPLPHQIHCVILHAKTRRESLGHVMASSTLCVEPTQANVGARISRGLPTGQGWWKPQQRRLSLVPRCPAPIINQCRPSPFAIVGRWGSTVRLYKEHDYFLCFQILNPVWSCQ